MKFKLALTAIAAFASTAAFAQEEPTTPTRSFEGENVEASKSASYDAETQTLTREGTVTNKNTGETVTQTQQRQFTENGSTYTSNVAGPNGNSVGASGERARDGEGNASVDQSVNVNGETRATRTRNSTRYDDGVNHSVKRSRAGGRRGN